MKKTYREIMNAAAVRCDYELNASDWEALREAVKEWTEQELEELEYKFSVYPEEEYKAAMGAWHEEHEVEDFLDLEVHNESAFDDYCGEFISWC